MNVALIVAFVAAAATPLVTYLIAVRKFSGKIETSDARELWAESRSIRDWSQRRIETLNADAKELEARVRTLEINNDSLAEENRKLIQEVHDLTTTVVELRDEIRVLTRQLKVSRRRVAELEEEPSA